MSIDPLAMERAITPRTRAVVPVHVSGRAADMTAIGAVAARHDLHVVEDAAEALGSKYEGRSLGTIGRAGCFSFSPNKIVGTGQGGAIVTDDDALHERLIQLKDQGRPARGTGGADTHVSVGFNFKYTNLQAAVGLAQLDRLPESRTRGSFKHGISTRRQSYGSERDPLSAISVEMAKCPNGWMRSWIAGTSSMRFWPSTGRSAAGSGIRSIRRPLTAGPTVNSRSALSWSQGDLVAVRLHFDG